MLQATLTRHEEDEHEIAQAFDELRHLRSENERLRTENRQLRAACDAYGARARSTALYGPIEMTAGTCVGPRRRRPGRL
jgi:hypothetical protein